MLKKNSKNEFNIIDVKSIIISFMIINITFLHHTFCYLWGNHDVKYIKDEVLISSGLFEGRFTQFLAYVLLVEGQILPVINNLLGLLFFVLGLWLLAKYWDLKKSVINYVLFICFSATQIYSLSWFYFNLNLISCFLWVLVAVLGLYLAKNIINKQNKVYYSFASILCFYLTLGGYPPIINLFFVCLAGRIILDFTYENKSIKEIINIYKFTLLNIIIAMILFKLTLKIVVPDEIYNLETESLANLPLKFLHTLKISFTQVFTTIPFMFKSYCIILSLIFILAILGLINSQKILHKKIMICAMIGGIIWLASLVTFLVVPDTEFVSRIDFYGFGFLTTFFVCVLLNLKENSLKNIGLILLILAIYLNCLSVAYALKIWKFGFDAEMRILNNTTINIENNDDFNINTKYRFKQVGDISLRNKYYISTHNRGGVFLLNMPYLAQWQGGRLVDFYAKESVINYDATILLDDFYSKDKDYFNNVQKVYPAENSVYIKNDVMMIFYHNKDLYEFKNMILEFMK